jgi:hypothetical protein
MDPDPDLDPGGPKHVDPVDLDPDSDPDVWDQLLFKIYIRLWKIYNYIIQVLWNGYTLQLSVI